MPVFNVRCGRLVTDYQITYVDVEAASESEALLLAREKVEADEHAFDWTSKECSTPEGGDVEAEAVFTADGELIGFGGSAGQRARLD